MVTLCASSVIYLSVTLPVSSTQIAGNDFI